MFRAYDPAEQEAHSFSTSEVKSGGIEFSFSVFPVCPSLTSDMRHHHTGWHVPVPASLNTVGLWERCVGRHLKVLKC